MRIPTSIYTRRCCPQTFKCSLISWSQTRKSSTHSKLLYNELTSRPPNIISDYLSPTPSHLLNISLADFLPASCHPANFTSSNLELPCPEERGDRLPQSHHLVYFSPQIPASALLPDGTDPLQSPGPPFVRRMWAGGSIVFNASRRRQLLLDNSRAACIERITDVTVKGTEGSEKVFVNIERQVGPAVAKCIEEAALVETRNIVFMREKDKAAAKADCMRPPKIVRPTRKPDFDVRMIPTQSLLFRFSALTFNAHAIHLDPQYCREVEGHRNLLLHGPLSLVLMLSVLRSQLQPGEVVKSFSYRNLAPLYANEELRVCVGRNTDNEQKYEVWIEGKEGGYAVKGSAIVGPLEDSKAN